MGAVMTMVETECGMVAVGDKAVMVAGHSCGGRDHQGLAMVAEGQLRGLQALLGHSLPSTHSVPGGAGRDYGACTSPVSMGSTTKTTNKTSARSHRPPPERVAGPLLQRPH